MNHILVVTVSLTSERMANTRILTLGGYKSSSSLHFTLVGRSRRRRTRILLYCYTARARIESYVFFAAATVCRRLLRIDIRL